MIYELLDTAAHPLVVVATIEDAPNTDSCQCGSSHHKALKVAVEGAAPVEVKALGLLTAISALLADSATRTGDRRMIRRALAKLLELSS